MHLRLLQAAVVLSFAVTALANDPGPLDCFQVFDPANLNIGDSVINITNAGTQSVAGASANICANVYTFSPDEQLISCRSCVVTPNALVSLSANSDLVSNTLTPAHPTSIVVKLVATVGTPCNASNVPIASLASGMRAWGTKLHALPTTPLTYGVHRSRILSGGSERRRTGANNLVLRFYSGQWQRLRHLQVLPTRWTRSRVGEVVIQTTSITIDGLTQLSLGRCFIARRCCRALAPANRWDHETSARIARRWQISKLACSEKYNGGKAGRLLGYSLVLFSWGPAGGTTVASLVRDERAQHFLPSESEPIRPSLSNLSADYAFQTGAQRPLDSFGGGASSAQRGNCIFTSKLV